MPSEFAFLEATNLAWHDDPQTEGQSRTRAVRLAQANRGTGLWHHQVGNGGSPVLPAWTEQGHGGMDAGLPGVEFETHGLIAPCVAK